MSQLQVALTIVFGALASPAAAQTPAQRPDPLLAPPQEHTAKWTLELGGGFGAATTPSSGSGQLPPSGPPIPVTQGTPVPRVAPSFFFGDGAAQWNGVFPGAAMQPIDAILMSPIAHRAAGSAFGLAVGRQVSSRWSADVNVEMAFQQLALTSSAQSGLQQSMVAFAQAFPPIGASAQAVFAGTTRAGGEFSLTAGATYWLNPQGRFRTFLSAGGGTLVDAQGPSPTLTGLSTLVAPFPNGTTTFMTSDHITLHANDGHVRPTGYVGGGVERSVTANTGLRFLVRAGFAPARLTTSLDAAPASFSRNSPASDLIFSSQTDAVVFSTNGLVPATLSAAAIRGFETFRTSGVRVQVLVSAGYFFRF